jgi:hypothetical protein
MKYVSIRCPSIKKNRACNHILGGIAIKTLENTTGSLKYCDVRYCPNCNSFWSIKIDMENPTVLFEKIKGRLDMVPIESYINASTIIAERV